MHPPPPLFLLQGNASSWIKTTIMMEEYLDGPEVDIDLVFSEGQPVRGGELHKFSRVILKGRCWVWIKGDVRGGGKAHVYLRAGARRICCVHWVYKCRGKWKQEGACFVNINACWQERYE